MTRLRIRVHGVVQGVGFRPLVYRQAVRAGLTGWVRNQGGSVELEVEGSPQVIERFVASLRDAPDPASVEQIERHELSETGELGFRILRSEMAPFASGLPADLAPCADCEREIRDPEDRRFGHAFASCIACGPRFSIALGLPYDRERTTMAEFPLCAACRREYEDPSDRRYHAEPIACPECGPVLSLVDPAGRHSASGAAALSAAAKALRCGEIVALRGLGGFQLLVDARSSQAVSRLRTRKHREEKPLAVVFPTLERIREVCEVSEVEARLLNSPARPIVLMRRRTLGEIVPEVAPGLSELGVFLPSTPLLSLLLEELGFPVVCTSGNLSGEPMCLDLQEALTALGGIADRFLVHDRPIARSVDDSVMRVGRLGIESIRRARGYAPLPVARLATKKTILAVGGYLKSTVALVSNGQVLLSQYLCDLDTMRGVRLLERTIDDTLRFHDAVPEIVACDLHPDYPSSGLAERLASQFQSRLVRVQHHHAHIAAVLAEHQREDRVLGLSWDGTGLGNDGTGWGAEALLVDGAQFSRQGYLRPFALPGGDRAAREPIRSALGLLFATRPELAASFARKEFGEESGALLIQALERGIGAPRVSSIGRLFDAVAGLLGVRRTCSYEGQAALELEALAEGAPSEAGYPLSVSDSPPYIAEPTPLVDALLEDQRRGLSRARIAARFQAAVVDLGVAFADRIEAPVVVLGGGCFQNRTLKHRIFERLSSSGRQVLAARAIPTNDAGLALGQAWVASRSP